MIPTDPPRLLVVDDSASARQRLTGLLRPYGRLDEAADGLEAVRSFENAIKAGQPYIIVFLDIVMPNLDGHGAARRIQRLMDSYELPENQRARIVMISTLQEPEHRMKAHFEDGAILYLPKPLDADTFHETLANLNILPNPIDDLSDETEGIE